MDLTDRDLAVLYYCWHNRTITGQQLRRKFWPERTAAAASKRLVKLQRDGFLLDVRVPYLKERVLYAPSKAGLAALFENGIVDPEQARKPPKRKMDFTPTTVHDLGVVSIRIALEETLPITRWISDRELRLARVQESVASRVPDGVFEIDLGRGVTATAVLEYERVSYRKTRLRTVCDRVRALYPGCFFILVSSSVSRVKTLKNWMADIGYWNKTPEMALLGPFSAVSEHGFGPEISTLDGRQALKLAPWRGLV